MQREGRAAVKGSVRCVGHYGAVCPEQARQPAGSHQAAQPLMHPNQQHTRHTPAIHVQGVVEVAGLLWQHARVLREEPACSGCVRMCVRLPAGWWCGLACQRAGRPNAPQSARGMQRTHGMFWRSSSPGRVVSGGANQPPCCSTTDAACCSAGGISDGDDGGAAVATAEDGEVAAAALRRRWPKRTRGALPPRGCRAVVLVVGLSLHAEQGACIAIEVLLRHAIGAREGRRGSPVRCAGAS